MKNDTIYILDSYGLIYRSYYAFINKPLINESGKNVSAIFGFFNNLLSLLQKNDVKYMVAAFDSRKPTFRHEMYKEYKATRDKTPQDLHDQIPIIEEILTALGISVIRNDGFEADDIIATICEQCRLQKRNCRILSGDKDLMQLVNDTTLVMKPGKTGAWETVDNSGVVEQWGVQPELMLDLLSLIGDKADNIPGINGVGEKTAQKLLTEYGNLDNILANAANIKGAIGQKIQSGIESAKFSRELIKLRYDVPINATLSDFSLEVPDYNAASRLLFRYGVSAIAKRFVTMTDNSSSTEIEQNSENALPDNIQLTKNVGNYSGIKTKDELHSLISKMLEKKNADGKIYIAFDSETDCLNTLKAKIAGFSLCNETKTSYYIPLITQESKNAQSLFEESVLYISSKDAISELSRIFSNKDVIVLMHNAKFDYEVLLSNGLEKPQCLIYDTMIAAWLLQPDRVSFSLEKLAQAKLFLETISFDSIVPKGKCFTDVPYEQAVSYGAEDSDLTFQLWAIFEKQLKEDKLFDLFTDLEMPLIPILAQMEINGIHIEKTELAEYSVELKKQIEECQSDIFRIVGHEFNIASPKQLQEVLFTERGLTTGKKTKTGFSTDTAVLEELATVDPVPAKILEYRKLAKLLSTYVDALPLLADSQDRLHTSFIQTGTATGRLSSRDPNLQNIPVRDENGRRIRLAFTATEGNVLISADYSQIELVVLAHLSKDANLQKSFIEGTDVHRATASLIFGIPYEQVTPDMRRSAKTINFGVIYGMSAFRLSNELGISRTQAKEFIDSYFATYSSVQSFMQETITKAEQTGYVETLFGRRRYITAINSKNKIEKSASERIAINTPIQGTAADIVKKAMIKVNQELLTKYPDAKLLLQVHDELIAECPSSQADQVSSIIKASMESIVQFSIPLKVSVEIGKRWGEFH